MSQGAIPSHPENLLPWFVNGTLEGEELRLVEEHLRSCLACRRQVEELRELRREVQDAAEEPPSGGLDRLLEAVAAEAPRPRRGWFRPWQPLLAAAVLTIVVGIGLWPSKHLPGPPPQQRAGEEDRVLQSLVVPGELLSRHDFVLRWQAAPEWRDARFSVIVTEADLTPVAEVHGLEVMQYQVAAEALADLAPRSRLFWRLEARRPDGTRRSELFEVQLK